MAYYKYLTERNTCIKFRSNLGFTLHINVNLMGKEDQEFKKMCPFKKKGPKWLLLVFEVSPKNQIFMTLLKKKFYP